MRSIGFAVLFISFNCFSQTLSGVVSSAAEGPMEGVLVSAKKDGSTITVTVVSDEKRPLQLPCIAPLARQVFVERPCSGF